MAPSSSSNIEQCPDESRCENGSKCVELQNYEGHYYCDCDSYTIGPGHAGLSCEYNATAWCTMEEDMSGASFCTNEGTCVAVVESTEAYMRCECPEGYEGPHCQYIVGSMPGSRPTSAASLSDSTQTMATGGGVGGGVVAGIVIVVVVAVLAAAVFVRRKLVKDRLDKEPAVFFMEEEGDDPYCPESKRISGRDLELDADGGIMQDSVSPYNGTCSFPSVEEVKGAPGAAKVYEKDGEII